MNERLLRFKLHKSARDIDRVLHFLVRSAWDDVAYYRDLLNRAGISPGEIRGVKDLPKLPVTTKQALVSLPSAFYLHRHADQRRCIRRNTSGSTGEPLTVYMSYAEANYRRLLLFMAIRQNMHLRLPFTIALIDVRIEKEQVEGLGVITLIRIPGVLPTSGQVELLERYRPKIIEGQPSCLEILAEELNRRPSDTVRPELVLCRGEILHARVRKFLEEAFSAKVADYYNCEEIGNIAWECPATPGILHVNTDACIIEIVGLDGSPLPLGQEGRVIVTNLFNHTMPFIRYDLGDRGVLQMFQRQRCSCGFVGPTMTAVSGRDDDFLYLPDGRKVSPRVVATAFEEEPDNSLIKGVRRLQIVQEDFNRIIVKVISGADYNPNLHKIFQDRAHRLHPELRCEVEVVDHLMLEPSGKFKKVVSKVRKTGEAS